MCGSRLSAVLTADRIPSTPLSPAGESLDRYRVIERLGEGNFGETFLVEQVPLGRRAFMKVMRESEASPAAIERLRREFSLISKLDHPAIARSYDVGQLENGRPYIVSEWIRGATLDDVLHRRQRLSVADAVAVAHALAEGLGCAHDAGILHRDVKPANIMIPGDDQAPEFSRAKLVDFGAFGELLHDDRAARPLTMAGMFYGTPRYMSPEQIQAFPQSPATDVYGLALVLSEMLLGEVPLTERGRTSGQSVLLRIVKEQITLPHDAGIPDALRELIERSLSKDPSARPQNGWAFASELSHAMEADVGRAAGAPAPVLSVMPPATLIPRPQPTRVGRFIGLAVAVLLVVVFVLLLPSSATRAALRVLPWVVGGLALGAGGVVAGRALRRLAKSRMHEVEADAERLLLGLRTRRALSDTLQIEVTRIIARCRDLDERMLGVTIMKMIHEYDAASESGERQSALMNVATLLEKLRGRLSPWYARFEKQLALATSALGIVSGVVAVVTGIIKLRSGQP